MKDFSRAKGKTVIIDNYDSFTYNLVHIVNEVLEEDVPVLRNDELEISDLEKYDYIILSPGPGIPEEAGLLKPIIRELGGSKKIFGVCLGLQAIGEVYGGTLKNLDRVFHGIRTKMIITEQSGPIFNDLPASFQAGRYHSWVVDKASNLDAFHVTAIDETGEIMGLQHKINQVYAVQFHPESIMTEYGREMLENFLSL